MKQLLLALSLFAFSLSSYAQAFFSNTEFKLGEIGKLNENIIDLNLSNTTNETIHLLRFSKAEGMEVKTSGNSIAPGEASLIRVKINPKKTGKFDQNLGIFLSSNSEISTLSFSGEATNIPKNRLQACPSFKAQQVPVFHLDTFPKQELGEIKSAFIQLTNQETKSNPISLAVETKEEEIIAEKIRTPRNPKARPPRPPSAPRNKRVVRERKVPREEEKAPTREEESNEMALNNHLPNHIIFLIDVSNSMNEENKLSLLKASMIELLDLLRPEDHLSIITYAKESITLVESEPGIDKERIKTTISSIQADGRTQAVKGIRQALHVGEKNFIKNGNNQIYLATDGAFNIGQRNESLRNEIKSSAKNDLSISVLAIKNDLSNKASLKEIVRLGEGQIIRINHERDASKVSENVIEKSKVN